MKKALEPTRHLNRNQELLPTEEAINAKRRSEVDNIRYPEINTDATTEVQRIKGSREIWKKVTIRNTGSLCKVKESKRGKLGKR